MASIKVGLLDNLHQKLRPTTRNFMISRFGLVIGGTSFILVTLIILFTNNTTPSIFYPSTTVTSWSFSPPNTSLTTSSGVNNATLLINFTSTSQSYGGGNFSGEGKNTHLVNLELGVKNVSFLGQELRNISLNSNLEEKEYNGKYEGECDIFDGEWVKDDSLPHYPPGSCPLIDTDFNCYLNGRPDQGFYAWRWQPNLCNISRLNATDFLERMRGRKLVFVGDSLNRNMWESLVCILRHSVKDKTRVHEISGKWEFKKQGFYAFRFEDYNCTIDYVRAPFLVRESTFQGQNGSFPTLRLDLMDETTKMYHDADILIFNTGHWWTHEKTSRGEDYYQEGKHLYPRLEALQAYGKALKTWGRWVDRHVNPNKTLVIFRGYSGTHFRGGQWNSGGQCHKETEPIFNETYLGQYPSKMRVLEQVIGKMKTPVMYLNISRLTDYRKDAHPSIYRMSYATPKEIMEAETSQDCSHWCLPGLPDIWNELLYASVIKVGWKPSNSTGMKPDMQTQ
ncbi:protein trichome birefringence-like 2 [Silene latifolia]|uniref:protein trichome birefringence-like 2 n=1 Tax=Silene latifolia TaxID=37657 RepID=UPI003D7724A8